MINHIEKSCGIDSSESPSIIYEDNAACITQMQKGYIKSNITKHIAPKLFYPHELQQSVEINILQTKSCDNLAECQGNWYETAQRLASFRGRLSE